MDSFVLLIVDPRHVTRWQTPWKEFIMLRTTYDDTFHKTEPCGIFLLNDVNPRLALRPLNSNGGSAKFGITSFVKLAIDWQNCILDSLTISSCTKHNHVKLTISRKRCQLIQDNPVTKVGMFTLSQTDGHWGNRMKGMQQILTILALIWFNYNPYMDKQSRAQLSIRRNYLSIPKAQRLHRWSLGMDK